MNIDTLVRDLCSVECRTKSQTRKLVKNFIEQAVAEERARVGGIVEKLREKKPTVSPPESDVYMFTLAQFNRVAGVNATVDRVLASLDELVTEN